MKTGAVSSWFIAKSHKHRLRMKTDALLDQSRPESWLPQLGAGARKIHRHRSIWRRRRTGDEGLPETTLFTFSSLIFGPS
jgi:hypothetical protein